MKLSDVKLEDFSMKQLVELRERIDLRIESEIDAELQALEEQKAKLQALKKSGKSKKSKPRGKVAAKYRDPKTGQTWSGRGMTPVWLRDLEEAGKKRENFLI